MTFELPTGRVVVVSPHLDDGILSVGASILRATTAGADVTVLTVMAGVADSAAAAGFWDRDCGFRTEGDAARGRREEDRRACEMVGATPVWLSFADMQYERRGSDDEIHAAVVEATRDADLVLVPGFPLVHLDHAYLAQLLLRRGLPSPVALYLEQPYVTMRKAWRPWLWPYKPGLAEPLRGIVPEAPEWTTVPARAGERRRKRAACRRYRTQLRMIGRYPPVLWRMKLYESVKRGETVGVISSANHRS